MARPGRWKQSYVREARDYCTEHHGTNQDIANHLGIPLGTLYDYKARHTELSEAIQEGQKKWRQAGCGTAVRSLYKMLEMQIIEVPKVRQKKKLRGEEMVVVERTEIVEKHVFMPNLKAIIFVLLNQDPDNWRQRPDLYSNALSQENGNQAGVLIVPAQEEFDAWLRQRGVESRHGSDGGRTQADKSSS